MLSPHESTVVVQTDMEQAGTSTITFLPLHNWKRPALLYRKVSLHSDTSPSSPATRLLSIAAHPLYPRCPNLGAAAIGSLVSKQAPDITVHREEGFPHMCAHTCTALELNHETVCRICDPDAASASHDEHTSSGTDGCKLTHIHFTLIFLNSVLWAPHGPEVWRVASCAPTCCTDSLRCYLASFRSPLPSESPCATASGASRVLSAEARR